MFNIERAILLIYTHYTYCMDIAFLKNYSYLHVLSYKYVLFLWIIYLHVKNVIVLSSLTEQKKILKNTKRGNIKPKSLEMIEILDLLALPWGKYLIYLSINLWKYFDKVKQIYTHI